MAGDMKHQYASLNPSLPQGERGRGEGAAPALPLPFYRIAATLTPNPLSLREDEGALGAACGE